MFKLVGAVIAIILLTTACSGHSTPTPSGRVPGASAVVATKSPQASATSSAVSARTAAIRLCAEFTKTVEPVIAKATKAKDGMRLEQFITAPANINAGFGADLLAATRAGAADVILAKDGVQIVQNLFEAATGTEFGTLATDVAYLKQDCAPYR